MLLTPCCRIDMIRAKVSVYSGEHVVIISNTIISIIIVIIFYFTFTSDCLLLLASGNYGAFDGLNPPQTIIKALAILSFSGLNLLLYSVHPFVHSVSHSLAPLFSKCFIAHSSFNIILSLRLQMLLHCTLCSSCPLSVLYISLFPLRQ